MNSSDVPHGRPPCIWCGGGDITEISGAAASENAERWFHCGFCHRAFCASVHPAADVNAGPAPRASRRADRVSIRIRKVPPSAFLEGVDLRPYQFQTARCYDVPRHVAEVLIDWAYAEPHARQTSGSDRIRALHGRSDA